jgi:hypothetical protein
MLRFFIYKKWFLPIVKEISEFNLRLKSNKLTSSGQGCLVALKKFTISSGHYLNWEHSRSTMQVHVPGHLGRTSNFSQVFAADPFQRCLPARWTVSSTD